MFALLVRRGLEMSHVRLRLLCGKARLQLFELHAQRDVHAVQPQVLFSRFLLLFFEELFHESFSDELLLEVFLFSLQRLAYRFEVRPLFPLQHDNVFHAADFMHQTFDLRPIREVLSFEEARVRRG